MVTANRGRLEKESALFEAISGLRSLYGGLRLSDFGSSREPAAVKTAREFLSVDLDDKLSLQDVAYAQGALETGFVDQSHFHQQVQAIYRYHTPEVSS